jgi:hypothetical protein
MSWKLGFIIENVRRVGILAEKLVFQVISLFHHYILNSLQEISRIYEMELNIIIFKIRDGDQLFF